MGLGIPLLKLKIMLESNPLTSIICVRRLAVAGPANSALSFTRRPPTAGFLIKTKQPCIEGLLDA